MQVIVVVDRLLATCDAAGDEFPECVTDIYDTVSTVSSLVVELVFSITSVTKKHRQSYRHADPRRPQQHGRSSTRH